MWDADKLAWFAGLFEGEGTFSRPGHGNTFAMIIKMTDEDVVRSIVERIGVGRVNGPFIDPRSTPRKPLWTWAITRSDEAYRLFVAIGPWLGQRRLTHGEELSAGYLSKINESHEDAFFKKIKKVKECWIWTAATNTGRPFFQHYGLRMQGQDFSYRTYVDPSFMGRIKTNCGEPLCVKPAHLRPLRAGF